MPVQLQQHEKIFKVIKKHWIVFYGMAWAAFMIIFGLIFTRFYFDIKFFGYDWQVMTITFAILTLVILYKYYLWRNNALIVTSQRLINKDQYGLFSKRVRAMLFEDIIDVSYVQKGITAVMCNYGTLIVRMSSGTKISLKTIPDPWKVVESLNQIKLSLKPQEGTEDESEEPHGQATAI